MRRGVFRLFPMAAAAVCSLAALPARADSSACIAHRPLYVENSFEVKYSAGCSGHDEPELFPVSSNPGSGRELTWTVVLPADGSVPVSAVGPAFWFGGTVSDPSSLFGQAFVELQFYPDALVTNCTPGGGYNVTYSPNTYTVCSPVWSLTQTGTKGVFHEPAAFNAMLTDDRSSGDPLVMHAGDRITIHWYTTPANDGYHVTVTDKTTGHSGTIVLNSKSDGPLMPAYDTQVIGNSLAWGTVFDAPNSFVWEIGHTSNFSHPSGQFCLPGQLGCESYNADSWAGTLPIQIESVVFGDGSKPQGWYVVSDFGGKAEVDQSCSVYGGPYCIYPWFSLGKDGSFHYGVDFPGTKKDFGKADQFQQTTMCGGPFGPDSTYCATQVQ